MPVRRQFPRCPWTWSAGGTHRPTPAPARPLLAAALLDYLTLCVVWSIICITQHTHLVAVQTTPCGCCTQPQQPRLVHRLLLSSRRASANLSISCRNLACRAALLASSAEETVQTTNWERCFRTIALPIPRGCARKPLLLVKAVTSILTRVRQPAGGLDWVLWMW